MFFFWYFIVFSNQQPEGTQDFAVELKRASKEGAYIIKPRQPIPDTVAEYVQQYERSSKSIKQEGGETRKRSSNSKRRPRIHHLRKRRQ